VTERLPRTRRPALVRRLSKRRRVDVDDALALREALEPGAAEMAARRALTADDRDHLRTCLAECEAASGIDDYRRADSRLHLAIAELTGSASLVAAVADVRMRVNGMLDAIPELGPNVAHSNAQHAQIVSAIIGRDPEAARRGMAEHVAGTAALLRGFLGEEFR
jgi:DNA-binding GntR family transcriptional regulator